jgi:predicted ATPase
VSKLRRIYTIHYTQLDLLAGEKASRQSAYEYHSAETYSQHGISLLEHDWVTDTYSLAMNLFNSAVPPFKQ